MLAGQPIAIDGNLVDVKNVNTHKVARLIIDVPAERAAEIIATFGWPTMVAPVPVAVARLNLSAAKEEAEPEASTNAATGRPPREWGSLSLATQAGIRCGEEAFWKFLSEKSLEDSGRERLINSTEDAAAYVRLICGVRSRADLDKNKTAARHWHELNRQFRSWMQEPV